IDCYIINTGFFLDKKVKPAHTLGLIEDIVLNKAKFVPFGKISSLEYYPMEGFEVPFGDAEYMEQVALRMKDRYDYIAGLDDFNKLPEDALEAIKKVVDEAEKAAK
ncbi:MAG: phosphoenolpyruvate carboxykinase, partial [Bacilli bacterium]|nr:phosphoenolpyruvate carboxykinase [Bacilli bacterium]